MKTSVLILSLALSGSFALTSCSGNKADNNSSNDEAVTTEVAETTVSTDSKLSTDQKNAIIDSKLATEADFSHTIYIDFNATWCGPCRQFAPFFKAASEKYADKATFIAVDTDQYGAVAEAFGVQSIPTMIAIKADGTYYTYIGTDELVGDGAFDAIVEKYL